MLAKSLIPILFILFIQTNVSKCFWPIFVDLEHEANLFDRFQSRFDILPRIAERFFLQSFYYTDEQPATPVVENVQPELTDDDYFYNMAQLENKLDQEQENFIHKFILHDVEQFEQEIQAMTTTQQAPSQEPAMLFIELAKNIEKELADDLIAYISKFTKIPLENFKDISINNNLVVFKAENATTSFLVDQILKYQVKILKEKEIEILSCGLVKNEDKAKYDSVKKSEQTKEILIIFGIVSLIALFSMFIMAVLVYFIKKRFFSPDGEILLEKKGLDDEDYLVNESKKDDSKWLAYVPFMKPKKADHSYSKDYQRMHSKVSPINPSVCTSLTDAQTPALPSPANNCQAMNNSNTINSTPIRITDAKVDQSRNSSW